MAWKLIKTKRLASFEQPRIAETQQVAGDDGVVQDKEVLRQEGFKIWAEAEIYQDDSYFYNTGKYNIAKCNRSRVKVELKVYSESTDSDYTVSIENNRASDIKLITRDPSATFIGLRGVTYDDPFRVFTEKGIPGNCDYSSYTVKSDELATYTVDTLNTSSFYDIYHGGYNEACVWHNADGTRDIEVVTDITLKVKGIVGGIFDNTTSSTVIAQNQDGWYTVSLKPVDKSATIITASNFTDEENPIITYKEPVTFNIHNGTGGMSSDRYQMYQDIISRTGTEVNRGAYIDLRWKCDDIPVKTQACISLDGITPLISYRDIDMSVGSYTFNLTEAEREVLRVNTQDNTITPIYFITKTTRHILDDPDFPPGAGELVEVDIYSTIQRNLTIVNCNPTLNPTVKDIKPETLALTGDENTFVRYESMAEYAINATANKHATIVSQSVQCGSKVISNLPNGVIDNVESGTFIFNVTDSRNVKASSSVFKNLVEYVKPTCYQQVEIEISGETGANIGVTVNGNYFNGSFGAAENTLKLEVRYTDDNGNWREWQTLSGTPTFNNNTYRLQATFSGFDYGKAYEFQCRATDKLNYVESSLYTIRMFPVFDWSEKDFNFNVPVNISADEFSMHDKTIIRHSQDTNNTVLSADSSNIYIRPGGTNSPYNQTIFYQNGNVEFSGDVTVGGTVNFNNSFTIGGYILNDYVIETGSEAIESNGTWYWCKWKSGRAEAWGCRNFGNMVVSTTWGNVYRSEIFTQDLPDNVFIRTPDAININFVHTGGAGWISKHEQTAPSAVTTGSFVVVRPVSGNITPTNIGFHIIGKWK